MQRKEVHLLFYLSVVAIENRAFGRQLYNLLNI